MSEYVAKVIVMQGTSGSGKSTYAKKKANQPGLNSIIVSADDFFVTPTGYVFDASKLGVAHAMCFGDFIHELRTGTELVIVDNTNSTAVEIAPYMLGASAFGYEAKIVRVNCSPRLAYERGKHGVSYDSIVACEARIQKVSCFPSWWVLEQVDGEASVTRMVK